MSHAIRTAFALGPMADRDALEAACLAEPGIVLSGFVTAHSRSLDGLTVEPHDALVVACAEESEELLGFIAAARRQQPQRPVVILYEGTANGFVRRAFEVGADDLITGAVSRDGAGGTVGRDIAFALEKVIARRREVPAANGNSNGHASSRNDGTMIPVLSPKGGTGKTLTSCNLAAALAAEGKRVVMVDLDLQFGDVGLALGLVPDKTLYELATSGGSLDEEKLGDFLATHESGVRVLMAPRRPDHAGAIEVPFLRDLFDTLRGMADFVVVDTPPGFSPEVIAAIDKSSAVCVVAMLDAPSLKNTKLALETLELMEYDRSRIKVILNRADSRVGVTTDDVTALLGHVPDVLVPSSREITRSVNEAMPVVLTGHNAEAKRAFQALAATFLDAEVHEPASPATVHGATRGRRKLRLLRLPKRGVGHGAA